MANNQFSLGRDTQLVVMGPQGRVDLTHVTSFEAKQMTHALRVDKLDGTQLAAELPKGWEGSFEVERGDSAVDDFIAAAEGQYFNAGGVSPGTMYQYITETDGSVSTYQYANVVFKLVSAGQWKGDQSVRLKLDFFATRRGARLMQAVVTDDTGRRIALRRMNVLERLRLFKAAGPELSHNDLWLGVATLACSVTAVDEIPVPMPGNEQQIEALVGRLGDAGIAAVARAFAAVAPPAPDAAKN